MRHLPFLGRRRPSGTEALSKAGMLAENFWLRAFFANIYLASFRIEQAFHLPTPAIKLGCPG
jgi:hypothetical protein